MHGEVGALRASVKHHDNEIKEKNTPTNLMSLKL